MAIGTTVKVGFDGEAVKKGFSGIRSGFASIGRSIGKGAAMMGGAMGMMTLEALILKAATGTVALADFAGAAEDVATQTGSTVAEIIKLNRALELAGTNVDAGRMLSTLSDNIYDATHGGQELQDVFSSIGLSAFDLSKMRPMEQFREVMKRLANDGRDLAELGDISESLLGGKMGMQAMRIFKNDDVMKSMGDDVSKFAENVQNSAGNLGTFADQIQRLKYLWYGINLAGFEVMGGSGNYMKLLFDGMESAINFRDFSKVGYILKAEFAKALEIFNDSAFMDSIRNAVKSLGESFGQGVKESMKGMIPSIGLPNIFGGGKDKSTTQLLQEAQRTNALLASIERSNGKYA